MRLRVFGVGEIMIILKIIIDQRSSKNGILEKSRLHPSNGPPNFLSNFDFFSPTF